MQSLGERMASMMLAFKESKVEGDKLWKSIIKVTEDEEYDIEIKELMRSVAGGELPKEILIQAIEKFEKQEDYNRCKKSNERQAVNNAKRPKHRLETMRAVAVEDQLQPQLSEEKLIQPLTIGKCKEQEKPNISKGCKRRSHEIKSRSELKHHNKKVKKSANEEEYRLYNQELPVEMKDKIEAMGGCDVKLVACKTLLASDIDPNQNRFLIPRRQSNKVEFLSSAEKRQLTKYRETKDLKDDMGVLLVEPSLQERHISLREWLNGTKTNYLLTSGCRWSTVVERNSLVKNDVVQLWSFRVDSQLYFALVIVKRAPPKPGS